MFIINNAHARPINDIFVEGKFVWTCSNDRTVKVCLLPFWFSLWLPSFNDVTRSLGLP